MVSYLCEVMNVSRTGFYNYFSEKSVQNRAVKDHSDEVLKNIILKAYYFRGRKKGARQIKMTLQNQYQITYNLKRIRRIMKKYEIQHQIQEPTYRLHLPPVRL